MKKMLCGTAVILSLLVASPVLAAEDETALPERPRPMHSTGPVATETVPGEPGALQEARFDQPLIRSADFIGNSVRGSDGDVLGKVSQVLFDAGSGQVRYLVVSAEGNDYLVPWKAVNTDPEGRMIALDVSASQFRKAPAGLTIGSKEKADELYRFYGVAPYWQERGERQMGGEHEMMEPEGESEHLRENIREPMHE